MNRSALKQLSVLAIIALLTGALFTLGTSGSRERLSDAKAEQERLESLRVRLTEQLAALRGSTASPAFLASELIWPGSDKATIERSLQAVATGLSDRHGLSLNAFSVTTGPQAQTTATVAFQLEGTADWQSLLRFMDDILAHEPRLGVSDLSIRTTSSGAAQDMQVIFRMTIWGFAPEVGKPS